MFVSKSRFFFLFFFHIFLYTYTIFRSGIHINVRTHVKHRQSNIRTVLCIVPDRIVWIFFPGDASLSSPQPRTLTHFDPLPLLSLSPLFSRGRLPHTFTLCVLIVFFSTYISFIGGINAVSLVRTFHLYF